VSHFVQENLVLLKVSSFAYFSENGAWDTMYEVVVGRMFGGGLPLLDSNMPKLVEIGSGYM
jgi:hypothetical protein